MNIDVALNKRYPLVPHKFVRWAVAGLKISAMIKIKKNRFRNVLLSWMPVKPARPAIPVNKTSNWFKTNTQSFVPQSFTTRFANAGVSSCQEKVDLRTLPENMMVWIFGRSWRAIPLSPHATRCDPKLCATISKRLNGVSRDNARRYLLKRRVTNIWKSELERREEKDSHNCNGQILPRLCSSAFRGVPASARRFGYRVPSTRCAQ